MLFVKYSAKFGIAFSVLTFALLLIVSISFGTIGSAANADGDAVNRDKSFIAGNFGLLSYFTSGESARNSANSESDELKNAPVFDRFNGWINSYIGNNYRASAEQINSGAELATERQRVLKELARIDPKAAFEKAIPAEIAERLPSFITDNSEKRISANGDFLVYAIDEANYRTPTEKNRTERAVIINNKHYQAFVYGRRQTMTTKLDIPLQGIIIDDAIIIDENPARKIHLSEYEKYNFDAAALDQNGVVAEIGGKAVAFSSESALADFIHEQTVWESKIGPVRPPETLAPDETAAWTEGAKTVLVLRVDFSDVPGAPLDHYNQPLTEARALSLISGETSAFYQNSSYNKTSMVGTVTPVLRLPKTQAYYSQGANFNVMVDDARDAAAAIGLDTNNFDLDLVCFSYTPNIGWVGIAAVGYKGALLNGAFYMPEAAHELGHNYGLLHANLWRATGSIGPGYNVEYGDCYDNMGACVNGNASRQFNVRYKRLLDWLTDIDIKTVTSTGVYRIFAQDSSAPGGLRALKIPKDASKNYWVEFRQLIPGNAKNGALIRWDYSSQNFRETQVLDMTPATTASGDEALLIGQTFEDATGQIKITVLGKGGTTPESLDVKVELAGSTTPTPTPTPTCAYSITPASQNFSSFGGIGSVNVTTQNGCAWTANANQSFAYVTSGMSGSGSGVVNIVVAPNAGQARTGTLTIANQTFTVVQAAVVFNSARAAFDFDGDGKADISVFRPAGGFWYLLNSASGFSGAQFGISSDKIVSADYDGDGRTDIAVYRSGNWYLNRSTAGFTAFNFGTATDIPQPADYDGDGRAEIAVFRPSDGVWYTFNPTTNQYGNLQFGSQSDKPVAADYDGDGRADVAVFRPSNGIWYINGSAQGFTGVQFGSAGDKPVPADYDGDGKIDVAVYRAGTWFLNRSQLGFTGVSFGLAADLPTPADYDGDGRADIAVYRGGTWYIQQTSAGFTGIAFGASGDKPVPNSFVP